MSVITDLLNLGRKIGGSAANTFGNTLVGSNLQKIGGVVAPNFTPLSTLKNWGGTDVKEGWGIVPRAQASELSPYEMGIQNSSREAVYGPRLNELLDIPEQDRNPAQKTEIKNLQEKTNTGGSNTTLEMLQRERDRKLAELDDAYNLAQRYGSDARNTLGRKRKGFEEEFANNASDIYDQFGRNRADLQVSSEGQDARTTRGLLAQGVGGSGLQEALRRNESARQQNYGQIREGRQKDDRINMTNKNERMSWADEQDASIDRYLGEALMRRNQGRNTTLDNFSNTLGGLISQAQQAAQALALSGQNIGSTEIEGIPLAGLNNGTFLNELQTAYQNSLGRDTSDTGNINANLANLSLTEQDKRLRGLLA